MPTDEELAADWRDGDNAARFKLLAQCYPEAIEFTRKKKLADEPLTTEVMQDLFDDLERRRTQGGGILLYTPPQPFRPWFHRCLTNAIRDRQRSEKGHEARLRTLTPKTAPVVEPADGPPDGVRRARRIFEILTENTARLEETRKIFTNFTHAQRALVRSYLTEPVQFLPSNAGAEGRKRNTVLQATRRAVIKLARLWGVLVKDEISPAEAGRRVAVLIDFAVQSGHLPPDLW